MKISKPQTGPPPGSFRQYKRNMSPLGETISNLALGEWVKIELSPGETVQKVQSYAANWTRRGDGKQFESRRVGHKTMVIIRTV